MYKDGVASSSLTGHAAAKTWDLIRMAVLALKQPDFLGFEFGGDTRERLRLACS